MELSEIEIKVGDVEQELETLKKGIEEGVVSKRSKIVNDLMMVYGHLKYHGKIVDIYKAFQKAGMTDSKNPRLAIVRADAQWCHLYKKNNGGAIFSRERKDKWSPHASFRGEGDVEIPIGTYDFGKIETRYLKTVAPIIPPRVQIASSLKIVPYHYHILFEAEYWTDDPEPTPPKDPIIGRMLTPNIFGVYATWDLTELEQSLLLGKVKGKLK